MWEHANTQLSYDVESLLAIFCKSLFFQSKIALKVCNQLLEIHPIPDYVEWHSAECIPPPRPNIPLSYTSQKAILIMPDLFTH